MMEHYIGVDLHKAFFQACAVTASGTRVWEDRFPRTPEGIAALIARCDQRTAVAVEASTPTWHFADALASAVGDLRIVDPAKTKLKAGYAAKTDRLDARRLADALRRESVVGIYHPPLAIRELRELCRCRHALVQVRTALINRLRAVLLRQGVANRRRLARTRNDAWLAAIPLSPQATQSVASLRRLLAAVRTEVEQADRDVQQVAAMDPIAQSLQQITGIGPILAGMIRAEIGDIRRFPTPAHLASYAGLVPRVDNSASRVRYGRITRRGGTVVTLGACRSGDSRSSPDRSHRALGPSTCRAERRAESPGRTRAGIVCGDLSTLDHDGVTSSPGRCGRTKRHDRRGGRSVNDPRPGPN